MDVKEKVENLFKNDVKQQTEEMGLNENVFQEKQNEDYNQSVVISTNSTKIGLIQVRNIAIVSCAGIKTYKCSNSLPNKSACALSE